MAHQSAHNTSLLQRDRDVFQWLTRGPRSDSTRIRTLTKWYILLAAFAATRIPADAPRRAEQTVATQHTRRLRNSASGSGSGSGSGHRIKYHARRTPGNVFQWLTRGPRSDSTRIHYVAEFPNLRVCCVVMLTFACAFYVRPILCLV
jgi:hypothetical protein